MISGGRRKLFNAYNSAPFFVKSAISHICRIIPRKYIYGRNFNTTLKRIKETEYESKETLKKLQTLELRKILLHAFRTTSYYRKSLLSKGLRERHVNADPEGVLKLMDFTDKRLIMDRADEFLSDKKNSMSSDYTSTGGTSGEPFYFWIDSNRSAKEWAFIVDMWGRTGFDIYSRRATFRGSRIRGKAWEDDWITKERKFSSFEITDDYLNKIWPELNKFKPDFIYGYTSTAITLCRFIERSRNRLPESVKAILIGSENIYDGQREYIENVSQKNVFMWYGHSEKLVLAGECEKSQNYHAYPQYGYIEFINEKGKPAEPGEFAEIVGTGFLNTVMPFIRYRTGDYCTYLGDFCPECGRHYHLFSRVRGRWTQEVLYGKKGNAVCMSAVNVHSKNFQKVFRFQFFQEKLGEAVIRIVPSDGYTEKETRAIEKEFNDKFEGNVKVSARIVDDIPLTERGKFKFIDQRITQHGNGWVPTEN